MDNRLCRERARGLLCGPGVRLKLILSRILVPLLLTPLLFFAGLRKYPVVFPIIAAAIIAVFGVIPAICGRLFMLDRMVRGEDEGLFDLIRANRILPRSILVFIIGLLPALPLAVSIVGGVYVWELFEPMAIMKNTAVAVLNDASIIIAGLIVSLLSLKLFVSLFFFPVYAMRGDMSVWQAMIRSAEATRGRMRRVIGFVFGFIGWFALGCASLGTVMLLHTLPYFDLSYVIFSRECLGEVCDV